ncbi:Crp/Fnr family transcriptional regulator [Pseudomonas syringae]|uniref:Crp/Fnr family transcriptional regulator n=1 Tax=Pseudomonas syringae TaxID=317 RepID=UPI001F36F0C8|nr:Crp/Fnr family transcriptional regulator [Pseudomonas syringae]MCF5423531.1 hypothetical protein [Pseudomonas syringae]MCF5455215.1 hypothetical protein [Pseudomonas syringae]MCF5460423.1 hypothetical protein [Pseudomonas syringae]
MHNSHPSHAVTSDLRIGTRHTLTRGTALCDVLAKDRDEFVLIEGGAIVFYAKSDKGERFYLSIISDGHVFTPQGVGVLLKGHDKFGARVMRDVVIRRIPRQQWITANQEHPGLYNWVIEQEQQQLQIALFHLAQHFQRSSLDRTRFALCTYAQGLGLIQPCGSRTIRVSRAELAGWIGVSSDRMCRLIRELHDTGEVTVTGRSIKVSNGLLSTLYPKYA